MGDVPSQETGGAGGPSLTLQPRMFSAMPVALRCAKAPSRSSRSAFGKGKARKPYEFGVKNAVVVSREHGLMLVLAVMSPRTNLAARPRFDGWAR